MWHQCSMHVDLQGRRTRTRLQALSLYQNRQQYPLWCHRGAISGPCLGPAGRTEEIIDGLGRSLCKINLLRVHLFPTTSGETWDLTGHTLVRFLHPCSRHPPWTSRPLPLQSLTRLISQLAAKKTAAQASIFAADFFAINSQRHLTSRPHEID